MTRKLIMALMAGAGAVLLAPAQATAAACGTVTASPGTLLFSSWNPLDGQAQDLPLTLTVQRVSASTRGVRVILHDSDTPAPPIVVSLAPAMRYEVADNASGALIAFSRNTVIGAANAAVRPINGAPTTSIAINARVRVFGNSGPVADYIGGRSFTQSFLYSIQCLNQQGQVTAQDLLVPANLALTVPIPRIASIVTARPSVIDFGNFTTTRQTILINVRSTSTLNVSANTQNGGKMVREGTPQPWPSYATIPFNMFFWDRKIIPGGTTVSTQRAGVPGRDINFMMTLPEGLPTGKLAGSYSDVITLEVTPGP